MSNYFFISQKDKSKKLIVLPLKGQKLDSGTNIDETKKVQCSKVIRESRPEKTIYVSSKITVDKSGKFYRAGKDFRRLNIKDAVYNEFEGLVGKDYASLGYLVEGDIKRTLFETIISDKTLNAPTSKDDGFFVTDDDWRLLVRNIREHVNTLIIGMTGSGKTSVVKEVCKRMKKKLYIFDMGSMIDPISSLLGVHRLVKGGSVFDYAKFTKVIQEPCVILFDELSRASLASMNILFPCLDDRRTLSVEVAGSDDIRDIKVHPEVTFMATANVGVEYSGTNSMDRALVNRFFPLELGCIPAQEETMVLINRTGIDKKTSELIVKVADNIRSLCTNKQEISTSLSIRETLMVAKLVSDGWDLGKAMELIYLPLYEGTKAIGERSTVYKTISSY